MTTAHTTFTGSRGENALAAFFMGKIGGDNMTLYTYRNKKTGEEIKTICEVVSPYYELIGTEDIPEPGGGGEGGTTNYNELVNKPKINNVELRGNKTSSDLGIGSALTAKLKASEKIGGVADGKEYAQGTELETIFRDMLSPVKVPALTAPGATMSASGGLLVEEGTTANKTLTVTFNRGKIDPAYGTDGYRSGAATGYSLNGGASQSGNTFTVTVSESNKTFTAAVAYAAGQQPKNSAGENYGEPLAAGSVSTPALTFEIVAALWSNAANIAQIAKEQLISKSTKQKQFNFPPQTAANPEVFDVPASWNVTAVELLNTLNNQWVNCLSEFTVTDESHGAVAYKRYTYNKGGATGARSVRIKWN